jgi:hypothetical protein
MSNSSYLCIVTILILSLFNSIIIPYNNFVGLSTSRSVTVVLLLALTACSVQVSAVPPSYLVATVAGDGSYSSLGDGGQATSATINGPQGIWQNSVGTLFIVEQSGHRVRAVSSLSGIISTVAGTGTASISITAPNGDNGPVRLLYCHIYNYTLTPYHHVLFLCQATSATLSYSYFLYGDTDGNLFIADNGNNRVRLVSTSTGIITRFAGTGVYDYTGDGGQVYFNLVSPPPTCFNLDFKFYSN